MTYLIAKAVLLLRRGASGDAVPSAMITLSRKKEKSISGDGILLSHLEAEFFG